MSEKYLKWLLLGKGASERGAQGMIDRMRKEECCGCQACVNICPSNCIDLEIDNEGFWYPKIDRQVCIECGMCETVCPFCDVPEINQKRDIDIYGAWGKDERVRFSSSSGGLFTVFAEYIIEQEGIVFGAKVDGNGYIIHSYADNKEDITLFRKSKYVQSNIGSAYQKAKEYLEQERKVLFSGTPCQILALHKFLGKEYNNLYTVDVICVGVSSPGVWKSYIEQLEMENDSSITNIIFRHKEIDGEVLKNGNRNLTMKIEFQNGKSLYQYHDKNKFFDGFLNKLYLRPSCAHCKAKNHKSGSDIQLGDFWEIENMYPEILEVSEDGKRIPFGISEVFIYTDKGNELFSEVKEKINSFKADRLLVEDIQRDTNWFLLHSSSQQHWNRENFFEEYNKDPRNVYKIIENNLNVRDMEYLSGMKIGMWGSYNLRNSIGIISTNTDCELGFQFRNSTIYSIMTEANPDISYSRVSSNPFRSQMLRYDLEKEFRVNIKKYADSVDIFVMDLLEERYHNLICGRTAITKSEGYFESAGIQGIPVDVSFEMWKDVISDFIQLVLQHFLSPNVILVENYLCYKYGKFNSPKYDYGRKEYIDFVNQRLLEKYEYIKKQWPEIKVIPKIPDTLAYTETEHIYGCIPEHMNYGACCYIAQSIGKAVER